MEFEPDPNRPSRVVGRYALYGKLATGGMATVHFGRLLGPVGFSRTVAIKRLHPQFAKDPEFVAMFLDEARLAARIQHPNVVATVDVVARDEELFLVMDYIRGESFSRILRSARKKNIQPPEGFIGSIVAGMLHGLHAAHEATDERGQPLRVVHRDVSPQNVLVGVDGVPRVLDFGVAKAAARIQVTRDGQMKGKLSYMSPEQLGGRPVDRRSDVFAAGVVLWEALTGERLFVGEDATEVLMKILKQPVPPPSSKNPLVRPELDALVLRALEKDPDQRYATAREFAIALENNMHLLSPREVGEWVEEIAGDNLERRERALAEIEGESTLSDPSSLTNSEPDATGNIGRALSSPRWQATGSSPRPEGEDAATTIYHGVNASGEFPSPGPRSMDGVARTQLAVGDITSPTGLRSEDPFEQGKRRKRVWVAAVALLGLLLVTLLVFQLGDSEPTQAVSARPSISNALEPAAGASATAEPAREPVINAKDLPKAEEPAQEERRAASTPKRWVPPPPPAVTRAVELKSSPCAQPWFVDDQGIRRIKSQCLQ